MSKEVEEAIDDFNFFNEGEYITREMAESKETVLNYIKELEEWKREKSCSIQEVYELFIPKSKIRDKIEELNKELTNEITRNDGFAEYREYAIEVLEGLLESEE